MTGCVITALLIKPLRGDARRIRMRPRRDGCCKTCGKSGRSGTSCIQGYEREWYPTALNRALACALNIDQSIRGKRASFFRAWNLPAFSSSRIFPADYLATQRVSRHSFSATESMIWSRCRDSKRLYTRDAPISKQRRYSGIKINREFRGPRGRRSKREMNERTLISRHVVLP